ncbi:MAG: pentapeptide repeat-containing protein [Xenococcaceae cyanobacterium]
MEVRHLNPYIIGRPIRANEPYLFFGRKKLFAFIKDNLLQGTGGSGGKTILLSGQRRIGKTSLLQKIPKAVDLKEFVFVQFDLQGRASQSLPKILEALAEEIYWHPEVEGKVELLLHQNLEDNPEVFATHFLPKVYEALDGKNLVLLLDEFDVLEDDRREAAANQFFPYLESLIQHQEKLFIIPVVGRRLDDMPRLLRLFRNAPNEKIGLLEREDARKLITKPAEDILKYSDEAIEAILELSSGHPYFTQLLCSNIFSRAREKECPEVTRDDVEAVIDSAFESGEAGLTWFWDGLPPIERLVFSAIAEAQEKGKLGELWSPFREYGVLQPDHLSAAERRLFAEGFLEVDPENSGVYKVAVELVRRWLVKKHSLRQELRSQELRNIYFELEIKEYLNKQIAKRPLESVFHEQFNFKDIYISLKPKPVNGAQILEHDLRDWAKQALEDSGKRDQVLFLEGETGQGKSTFCRMFADWIQQHGDPPWTPILIQLRDIKVLEANFEKTLQTALRDWHFAENNDNWLKYQNTRFVFLLDGLDELITERKANRGLEAFLQQVIYFQRSYGLKPETPEHRVLITSSPSALQSLKSPVIQQQILPHLERVKIQPMDEKLQNQWINKKWAKKEIVGSTKALEFMQFLDAPPGLRSLAREPLLLYLLAAMYRDDELEGFVPESSDEETKLKIYEKSLDWVITKQLPDWLTQELEEGRNEQKTKDLERILAEAGLCAIQSGGIRTTMTMLEERLANKDNRLANWLIQRAKTRREHNTAIASFSKESTSKGWVTFNHKSFSEFLYAKRLLQSLKDWTKRREDCEEFVLPTDRLNWEIYDLLGFGGLTQEIVGYLRPLLKKISKDVLKQLFERLQNFHIWWFEGEFINNELAGTLAQKKMLQLKKPLEAQGLFLGRRQIDIYTGLNVLILLLELHREAQIHFYPCGKFTSLYTGEQQYSLESRSNSLEAEEAEEFEPSRILRLMSYSRWLGAEIFVKTVGPFLEQINLRGADLRGAELYGVKLNRAYLSGAILNGINLNGAELNQAFLGNAKLRRADLGNAILSNAFLGNADLSSAFLGNASLDNAVLTGANLHTALLGSANLSGAYLGDADLSDANLRGANLMDADLSCANLSDANLKGANLSGTNLRGANLKNVSWDKKTNWQMVKSLQEALNIPKKLKS